MTLSIFLAKVLGLYLVVVMIAGWRARRDLPAIVTEYFGNRALMIFSGALALLFSLALVVSHNIWTADFRGLITAIGWLGLIKGFIRLFAPTAAYRFSSRLLGNRRVMALWFLIFFLIGLYLTAVGFGWLNA